MSILTIRGLFEKRWFQAIMIFLAVAFVLAMLIPSIFGSSLYLAQDDGNPTAFVVGGREIKSREFGQNLDGRMAQFGQASDPELQLQAIGGTLDAYAMRSAANIVAQKHGAKSSDELLRTWAKEDLDFQFDMIKMQMQMQGQLKTGTQAEFEEAFKKQNNQTVEEAKKRMSDDLEAALKDPERKKALEEQFLTRSIEAAVSAKTAVTEEDLKASYDTFRFARISSVDPALTPDKREEAAKKAREEIAAGKPVAEVYERVMKSKMGQPTEMTRSALEANETQKAVLSLKQGESSPVVQEFGNPTFYHLIGKTNTLPPDFEKNKAKLLADFKLGKARTQVSKEIEEAKKLVQFDWKTPSLKVLYSIYKAKTEPIGKTTSDFEALLKDAEALEDGGSYRNLAIYSAFNEMFNRSTPDQQKELKPKKAEVLAEVLRDMESVTLRMQLVDLYVELKDGENAAQALTDAATTVVAFDPESVANAGRIELKASQLQNSKLLTKEQADEVREIIASWRKEMADYEKQEAELKRQAEEEDKKIKEEDKKRAAEEQKALEAADKKAAADKKPASDPKPATSGTDR